MENFDSGLSDHEKKGLEDSLKNVNLPSDLEARTINALRTRGAFAKGAAFYKIAISLLFGALIFTAGFFAGSAKEQNATAKNVIRNHEVDNKEKYLLLLYEPAGFINADTHVAEYGAWAQKLGSTGNISGGEALKNSGWNIMALGVQPAAMGMNEATPTGFFILKASSEREALQIAKTCPHLKYKGTVQLRPIQN